MVESLLSGLTAISQHPLSGNTIKSPCPRYSYLSRAPRTITGHGERPMSGYRSSQNLSERQVSGWTQIDEFEGIDPRKIDQTRWQDYEIPKELEMVQADTLLEIRRIITASVDKHRSTDVNLIDRENPRVLVNGNVTQSVTLEPEAEPDMANRSCRRSPRATSGTSDMPLTSSRSSRTDSERTVARSSVSSISSAGFIPEPTKRTVPVQRTPGLPKEAMGPLVCIVTYDEGEKAQSWWRRCKGLKKPKAAIAHNQVIAHDTVTPTDRSNEG